MHTRVARAVAAIPDAALAVGFLALWVAPLQVGAAGVGGGLVLMLVEFLLVHATGFLGAIALNSGGSRLQRSLTLSGLGLFYLLFFGAWSLIAGVWWPLAVFGWLLLGKFGLVLGRQPDRERRQRMQTMWVVSTLAYILGAFLTSMLPLPVLGLGPEVVAGLDLPGTGLWVEQPHRVMAFGLLYFGTLATVKALDLRFKPDDTPSPAPPHPPAGLQRSPPAATPDIPRTQ